MPDLKPDLKPDERERLQHAMNCGGYPGSDDPCTCGLEWRIQLQTEREMHNAWRKRAEESESQLTAAQAKIVELERELGEAKQHASFCDLPSIERGRLNKELSAISAALDAAGVAKERECPPELLEPRAEDDDRAIAHFSQPRWKTMGNPGVFLGHYGNDDLYCTATWVHAYFADKACASELRDPKNRICQDLREDCGLAEALRRAERLPILTPLERLGLLVAERERLEGECRDYKIGVQASRDRLTKIANALGLAGAMWKDYGWRRFEEEITALRTANAELRKVLEEWRGLMRRVVSNDDDYLPIDEIEDALAQSNPSAT